MKSLILLTILMLFSFTTIAQEESKKKATIAAEAMIKALNEKDFVQYVNYLTPGQGDYKQWEKALKNDTRSTSDVQLIRFGKFETSQQAYFSCKFGNENTSFFGISKDNGENWHFTQFIRHFNYENIKSFMITELDSSFKDLETKALPKKSYKMGKQISPFEYKDLNGNIVNSEKLKGKTIVLNFWSTTCEPCIKEIPQLNKLVEKMKNKDIVFIGLAFNSPESVLLKSFLPQHPFLYQIVSVNGDDYSIRSLPTHIVINKDQIVVGVFEGGSQENIMKIEAILNEL